VTHQQDPSTIKAEFRRRLLRQFVVAVVGGVVACYFAARHDPMALLGFGALILAVRLWSRRDWRCPACGQFLGYGPGWWVRKQCPHCWTELQG
jgi:hypothetical protein